MKKGNLRRSGYKRKYRSSARKKAKSTYEYHSKPRSYSSGPDSETNYSKNRSRHAESLGNCIMYIEIKESISMFYFCSVIVQKN